MTSKLLNYMDDKLYKAFSSEKLLEYKVIDFEQSITGAICGSLVVQTTSNNKVLMRECFESLESVDAVDDWLANVLSIMLMNHGKWYK